MKQIKNDLPIIIIAVALITTLTAYFAGLFPYPFGFLILGFALLGRILQLRSMK